jgi:SAM-dependent methyltransferase
MSFLNTLFRFHQTRHQLTIERVSNFAEYQEHLTKSAATHQSRWRQELDLSASGQPFTTLGYCFPCQQEVKFRTDFMYSHNMVHDKPVPNWRERVLCPICQMNNRTRASIQILGQILRAKAQSKIYIAEQVTPLYGALKKRYPKLIGSEYLGDKVAFGSIDDRGVRNESITKLTFADDSFDYILNFDVLEHVPDAASGLKEIFRTMAPNGTLLLSAPFLPHETKTQIRATIDANGNVTHLLPAQFHGDPIADAGCLCFQDFGWELLDQMRAIGFTDVAMMLYWSDSLGYYGVEQMMIIAKKR